MIGGSSSSTQRPVRHAERPAVEPGADHDPEPQRIALEALAQHVVDDAVARHVDAVRVPLPGEGFEEAPAVLAHQPLGVAVADERIVVQGILHAHASAVERGVRHRIDHPTLQKIVMSAARPGDASSGSSRRTAGTAI
jgi:hypothetical protein